MRLGACAGHLNTAGDAAGPARRRPGCSSSSAGQPVKRISPPVNSVRQLAESARRQRVWQSPRLADR
ncbi:hypothetical protein ACPA9J_04400 [Pseudomonas aeruginosa]